MSGAGGAGGGAGGGAAPKAKGGGEKKAQGGGGEKVPKVAGTGRRDRLREIEARVQKKWSEEKIFEVTYDESRPKFFLNFPYPYMNGRLHLGHAFSLTKAEFTARFQRLQGKNVLFPFAFHCTGMPIQAAANKLRDELTKFGNPPVFPEKVAAAEAAAAAASAAVSEASEVAATAAAAAAAVVAEATATKQQTKSPEAQIADKSKGGKSKQAMMVNAGPMRQWDILCKMLPEQEVAAFADPVKWLNYFPPLGATDLQAFGSAIDWRRSFITTSTNLFYDAFIRWQFNRLREGGRIKFGTRPSVYSILDGQVCADHDRASGEGVGPQEYTIVKLLVITPYPAGSPLHHPDLVGKNVYLAPATLRPETMYGQTNCFVLPEGNYGAFETSNGDVLIVSQRAATGLAHQGFMTEWGKAPCIVPLKGTDLLGLPLKAPNAVYERVYTLPLMTISMTKGTGVVTSVPSDAPDDYAALRELKEKPLWREKFGLTAEMVEPYEVVPIIEIPGYGTTSAVFMCDKLDIKSCKDTDKLKEAKDEVYLKGFYEGVMLVGECIGMKVCDAKPLIRKILIDRGDAIAYFEPESMVMSRSGDECVVALTDQWYLAYGEADWAAIVSQHIHSENFNGYNDKIMEKFDFVLGWLNQWACSRQFGLGTKLPWDEQWVIESLSDSTIYMAYYTIAHHLHGSVDNLAGPSSPSGIVPADLTDDVFNFIFLGKDLPEGVTSGGISPELLGKMRAEFEYWYPFDLRVSAKDLIPNHLTMSLYNHVEIWKDRPQFWPRGIYCNGHIMVDAEKMSKSAGNFLMLLDCVELYSADATRFACADAGDSMEDANFDRLVANSAISYLWTEEEWAKSIYADKRDGKLRSGELNFMDRTFNNEIDFLVEATFVDFEKLCYKEGLKKCWYEMMICRDLYRDWSTRCSIPMHESVVMRFIRTVVVMMAPICPHWSENLWELIELPAGEAKSSTVCDASWPPYTPHDPSVRKQYTFFKNVLKQLRQQSGDKKVKITGQKCAYVYLASSYEEKKVVILQWLQSQCDAKGEFPADLTKQMMAFVESRAELKASLANLMQFGKFMYEEAAGNEKKGEKGRGLEALAITLPFDQKQLLEENALYLAKSLDLASLSFHNVEDGEVPGDKKKYEKETSFGPGQPAYHFYGSG